MEKQLKLEELPPALHKAAKKLLRATQFVTATLHACHAAAVAEGKVAKDTQGPFQLGPCGDALKKHAGAIAAQNAALEEFRAASAAYYEAREKQLTFLRAMKAVAASLANDGSTTGGMTRRAQDLLAGIEVGIATFGPKP